ncbi:uncharacterized protein BO72DRAFT_250595 [Aspergillus fijiensis CBS 313.89]|uniref:Secreted protein n=1 Tax=Aspergillus fijiensis CBS 313.89 TaxID=1448319 RepID=A0A8G1VU74_9EURO|nr:uncharacterized protein BO72DRAFT_250595 [Aspergillus fijiensis CBS 313.89]RAK73110.1 hypothetical protein BO72DRAFT_250595 [Aspergillus fijiensis CBS 313.89]
MHLAVSTLQGLHLAVLSSMVTTTSSNPAPMGDDEFGKPGQQMWGSLHANIRMNMCSLRGQVDVYIADHGRLQSDKWGAISWLHAESATMHSHSRVGAWRL